MHPTDVDPGVTLAGRYRVAELLAEAPGDGGVAQTWRAVDEVLSRSVVVHVLAADDPRAPALLEASRRAATVTDARFIRVLDAMGEDGVVYVVREWVQGRNLGALLADGPLPPRNAGLIVREVAEALASAHAQGLTHERLDPASLVITDAGSIKIVGLATQKALTSEGDPNLDPARADALGLGRLLYAGLTARWPTGPRCGLEAALRAGDGTLLSPRQCLAGIPKALDEITERILSDQPRHGTPLTTPEQVAEALIEAVGITPPEGVLPQAEPPPSNSALSGYPPMAAPSPGPALDPAAAETAVVPPSPPVEHPPMAPHHSGGGYLPPPVPAYRRSPGTRLRRGLTLGVGVVLFLGLILLGVQLTRMAFETDSAGETPTPSAPEESPSEDAGPKPGTAYRIQAAQDYDPTPGSDGEEHPDEVAYTYDGDPSTVWTTMAYRNNPKLGGLKPGVGIWFDLGEPKKVGSVELTLLDGGTDLQLMAAPNASTAPETIDGWQPVAEATGAGASVTLEPDKPVTTRYILVWFTKLPHEKGVDYRGGIAEIVIRR